MLSMLLEVVSFMNEIQNNDDDVNRDIVIVFVSILLKNLSFKVNR